MFSGFKLKTTGKIKIAKSKFAFIVLIWLLLSGTFLLLLLTILVKNKTASEKSTCEKLKLFLLLPHQITENK